MTNSKKPHIVLFNVDQWRGDAMGHLGDPAVKTPNLDRLVDEDAVSFSSAFCQNPVCTPSRCSFMTGWYPHTRGHRTMHYMLRRDEPVLIKTLKEEGYFVWWGGKNDLIPAEYGYDDYCTVRYRPDKITYPGTHTDQSWRSAPGSEDYFSFYAGQIVAKGADDFVDSDWAVVNGAVETIADYSNPQPLCLFLALTYPHPPYGVEAPWYGVTDRSSLPPRRRDPNWEGKPSILRGIRERQGLHKWSEEKWSELRGTYYDMCARSDHQLGMVIDALKKKGIYDDTLIIFFSDHGDYTGDYDVVEKSQNCFEDCLTRVPLVIKPPSWIPTEPGVRTALTELIDISATIEDIASVAPKHTHFGRSLRDSFEDPETEHRDAVFCEGGRLQGEEQAKERESTSAGGPDGLYWPRISIQIEDGPEHTKAIMCRTREFKYVRRLYERDELYDLTKDPTELQNVSGLAEYRDVEARMSDRLLTHLVETTDMVPFDTNRRW